YHHLSLYFFHAPPPSQIYTLSLHDALPIYASHVATGTITALIATALIYLTHWPLQPLDLTTASAFAGLLVAAGGAAVKFYKSRRSEEHTSELQSLRHLVCRLLLEKKKKK